MSASRPHCMSSSIFRHCPSLASVTASPPQVESWHDMLNAFAGMSLNAIRCVRYRRPDDCVEELDGRHNEAAVRRKIHSNIDTGSPQSQVLELGTTTSRKNTQIWAHTSTLETSCAAGLDQVNGDRKLEMALKIHEDASERRRGWCNTISERALGPE